MIEVTPEQAHAVATLAASKGTLTLHQIAHTERGAAAEDLYATPAGAASGFRIARDGTVAEIGETLPANA